MHHRPGGASRATVCLHSDPRAITSVFCGRTIHILCGVDAIFLMVIFALIKHTIKTTITKVFKSVIQYYTRELYMDNVKK